MKPSIADFAAGCFWGIEETFRRIPGVLEVQVGYEGGTLPHPTYEDVCSGRTGHAETVRVTFDPARVGYARLLDIFFNHHDPTTPNRQGPDVGHQYRSVIFFHTPEQQQLAQQEKQRRDSTGEYARPLVTAIEPATTFYPAEEYHQRYYEKHGLAPACHLGNGKRMIRHSAG